MPSLDSQSTVLVTGATGFIGAHVVDGLLRRGCNVRAATRSDGKAQGMRETRTQYASQLDFAKIGDFTGDTDFTEAVQGVDGIVHAASPLTYTTTNNEQELILPAINGTKALLAAAAKTGKVKRIVMTSSFASIVDINKKPGNDFVYTGADWNPLTYAEAVHPDTNAVVAYRGSKKFAELAAWDFVRDEKPTFDLVTFCPPMTFGPVVHPVESAAELNESNARLWDVAVGKPLPEQRVPVWVDVRDLAKAHVEALFVDRAGRKRYAIASPENWSYEVASVVSKRKYGPGRLSVEDAPKPEGYKLDWKPVAQDLGVDFHPFEKCVDDLFDGLEKLGIPPRN